MDEVVGTDYDEDEAVEVAPRQLVPLKLGNAKELDGNCSVRNLLPDNYIILISFLLTLLIFISDMFY